MSTLSITKENEDDKGWRFLVEGHARVWSVSVDRDHWQRLTSKAHEPRALVKASFAFLLEREGPEDILSTFDLRDISTYFPEYEEHITDYVLN